MSALKQAATLSSSMTTVRKRDCRHHGRRKLSRLRPYRCQAQVQAPQPLPPLLQRPGHCSPPSISAADPELRPSPSETRSSSSSATALDVLRLMDGLQVRLEADTYSSLLRDCAASGDSRQGAAVHAHLKRQSGTLFLRHPSNLPLANRLLHMYAACNQAAAVRQVFDQMRHRDSLSRVIAIAAVSENGGEMEAIRMFVGMHAGREGWWAADSIGFKLMLWTSARAADLGFGQQLHGLAVKFTGCSSFSDHSAPLIKFYAKLWRPDLSLQLMLAASPAFPGVVEEAAWGCIISAYCRGGSFKKAMWVFREMERRRRTNVGRRRRETRIKRRLLATILSTCSSAAAGSVGSYEGGRQLHAHAVKLGVDGDGFVGRGLVVLYSAQGSTAEARRAFDAVGEDDRDVVCWNEMLGCYVRRGGTVEAFRFLNEMYAAGVNPRDSVLMKVWNSA
ncbi:Pentatricopeptide repeat-containing protein [Apostasia shenzhenica]|uniref:Pentatricopeptide repeat-containing protein n=1 Tax=Apostasia shenzhenica TaxID=1088818 RepID=A0A2I0A008_9ASPA|nr:Pentatricopeptide repeat-containing protein [Apostasia shenzhenica]